MVGLKAVFVSFGMLLAGSCPQCLLIASYIYHSITLYFSRDIFIGDAVVQVNDKVLSDISHDEALKLLASSGPSVKLVLKHYKAATPFLLKQFGRSVQ